MAKFKLRHFFYLNEVIVDDYLSQLEGGLEEGAYTTRESRSGNKGANIGLKYIADVGVNATSNSSTETVHTIRETPTAKFNRMYRLLKEKEKEEGEEIIHPLSGFDQAGYDDIEIAEIVEIRGIARLAQWEKISKSVKDSSNIFELMKLIGQDPTADKAAYDAYKGMTDFVNMRSQEDTVIIIEPIGAPEFKFVARLEQSNTLSKKELLETEITIFGKIIKKLSPGEEIDVFKAAPDMAALQHLNREQRRQAAKDKAATATDLDEKVSYPAIEIQPVAIYQ